MWRQFQQKKIIIEKCSIWRLAYSPRSGSIKRFQTKITKHIKIKISKAKDRDTMPRIFFIVSVFNSSIKKHRIDGQMNQKTKLSLLVLARDALGLPWYRPRIKDWKTVIERLSSYTSIETIGFKLKIVCKRQKCPL